MRAAFNHNLVLLGRQLRKINQSDLAKYAEITQGHLSKIENGLTEPSEDVLKNIAQALEIPEGFFSQPDRIYGLPLSLHPMYRKKASVGQHALDSINAEINIRLIHLRRLIKSATLTSQFPLPQFDVNEYGGNVDRIAEMVRRSWLLPKGPIQNLTECIEQAGCIVIWCHFPQTPIYGISYQIPDLPPCIFVNQEQPADRMRFTLAHELGHLIMHHIPAPEMEDQANKFASSLLMPTTDIKGNLSGKVTLPRIASLKPIWKVSMQAIVEKAADMGALTPSQHRAFWQQINSAHFRFREPPELDFPHEEPKILEMIFEIHKKKLNYTTDDIAQILNCNHTELFRLYPFLNGNRKRHLRLVSS